jgi:hypothetical protein
MISETIEKVWSLWHDTSSYITFPPDEVVEDICELVKIPAFISLIPGDGITIVEGPDDNTNITICSGSTIVGGTSNIWTGTTAVLESSSYAIGYERPKSEYFTSFSLGEKVPYSVVYDLYSTTVIENGVGKFTGKQLIELDDQTFDRFYSFFNRHRREMYDFEGKGSLVGLLGPSLMCADMIMENIVLQRRMNRFERMVDKIINK